MAPSKGRLAKIHILKNKLNLSDDEYRSWLANYHVNSSRLMNNKLADRLINEMDHELLKRTGQSALVGRTDPGWGKDKYEHLRHRRGDFAEPQQLRKIEAMWREVARDPSDKALMKFLKRQTGITNIEWLKKEHVRPVLVAINDIKKQNQKAAK